MTPYLTCRLTITSTRTKIQILRQKKNPNSEAKIKVHIILDQVNLLLLLNVIKCH